MTRLSGSYAPFLITVLLLTSIGACGGNDTTPPSSTPGTLSVSVAQSTGAAVTGTTASVAVIIARGGSFSGAVTLAAEGVPAGVSATFTPASLPPGVTTSSLALAVAANAAAGTYPITIRAAGASVSTATATFTLTVTAPTLSLTLTPTAVTITQAQQSAAIPIIIARGGGLTGNVQLALEGAPTGVTGVFTPNPATAASSQLVVSVAQSTAPGVYNLVVRGTANPVTVTSSLALTVTAASQGDFALAVVPSTVTVTAGQFVNTTVNIGRSGGFTGAVNLTVTGLPTGVTANVVPASATGAQAQLSITAAAGTAPGSFTAVVRGNATGLVERTVNLGVTVQAATGPGTGNVTFRYCNAATFPLWFAYRDGVSGTWTRVLPGANQTFTFTINESVGSVAVVTPIPGAGTVTTIFQRSRAEFIATSTSDCPAVPPPSGKIVSGSVAGLSAGQTASIGLGGGSALVSFPSTTFTLNTLLDRVTDLVAVRSSFDSGAVTDIPDRFLLRRNLNPAAGSTLPVIDFNSAEAFAPATATYTVVNAGSDQVAVTGDFATANGTVGIFLKALPGSGNSRPLYGIPAARTMSGDLHVAQAIAIGVGNQSQRSVTQFNRELQDRTITLGSVLSAPTFSTLASAPYLRYRASGQVATDYDSGISLSYSQVTSQFRSWTIIATVAFLGSATSYSLDIPDLSAVAGFDSSWGLQAGSSTSYSMSANRFENIPTFGVFVENSRLFFASRTGSVP